MDEEPNGWGKLERENFTYEGFFSGGQMQTYGKFVFKEGDKQIKTYSGLHENGNFMYFGVLEDDAITFKGKFLEGEMYSGELLYKETKQKFVGSFKDNLPHGKGKLTFKNTSYFEGGFFHGKFNGQGLFKSHNNECLEGEWKDGLKEGFFNRNKSNGVICKEEFQHDRFVKITEFSNVGLVEKQPVRIHGEGTFDQKGSGKGRVKVTAVESERNMFGINKDNQFSNFSFAGNIRQFKSF